MSERQLRFDRRTRRNLLDLDLNVPPPPEPEDPRPRRGTNVPVIQHAAIDVEAIEDDDVVICSPLRFAEARSRARRNRVTVLDEDANGHVVPVERTSMLTLNNSNRKRRRTSMNQATNFGLHINLEGVDNAKRLKPSEPSQSIPPPPPPPPKVPTFSCPVCMGQLTEETSTKCGHIFCRECIRAAISVKTKCPTCRRKVTLRDTFRVYLPALAE